MIVQLWSWSSLAALLALFGLAGPAAPPAGAAASASEQSPAAHFAPPQLVGREDEFCRRAYRIMMRGSRFLSDLYREWPTEPNCGYLGWGGSGEKEINGNLGFAYLYALLLRFGAFDETIAGVTRQEAQRRVVGVIRYAAFTHFSGPHTCTDGRQWGGGWHGASWSSVFAQLVWFTWDELDAETRQLAARVIVAEADRFIGVTPPSGKIDNTRAEDNAWNSRAMAVACVMLPSHPRSEQWLESCRRYMMNTLSVAADKRDDAIVDGRPVREWITTENVHPDFTLENHGIVYPVYMWASMVNLAQSAGYFIQAGAEPPRAAFHHMRDVYEVYKQLQGWEGLPAYINGSDKFLHLQVVDILVHSFFAQVLGDAEAAHLEEVELDILERMQARFADGRLYPEQEVGPWSRVNNLSIVLGNSYLLHYLLQNPVQPVSRDVFEARIRGVRVYPDGKFVLHRTPDSLVSFAWSKPHRIMGLAVPREGNWLVTPNPRGFVGTLLEEGSKDEGPMRINSLDVQTGTDEFTVKMVVERCAGKVEHAWMFASRPGGVVIMSETLTAKLPVTLTQADTGTMGIGRELDRETITLLAARSRSETVGPMIDGDDVLLPFPENHLLVDKRFIYAWKGTGSVAYLKHNRPTRVSGAPGGYGHLEDLLFVRHLAKPTRFAGGEIIASGRLEVDLTP